MAGDRQDAMGCGFGRARCDTRAAPARRPGIRRSKVRNGAGSARTRWLLEPSTKIPVRPARALRTPLCDTAHRPRTRTTRSFPLRLLPLFLVRFSNPYSIRLTWNRHRVALERRSATPQYTDGTV